MSNQLPLALLQITEATHTCRRLIVFIGEKQDPSVITVIEIGGVYMIVKAKSCLLHRNKATAHTGAGEWGTPTGHYMHAGNPQLPSFGRALFLYFVFFFFFTEKLNQSIASLVRINRGTFLGWIMEASGRHAHNCGRCQRKGVTSRAVTQGNLAKVPNVFWKEQPLSSSCR